MTTTLRPKREGDYSPSNATVMNARSFSSVFSCIRSEQLYCCHLCCFSFLQLDMLSAARRAQYSDWATVWTVQGSNSVKGKWSPKRLPSCMGYFLEVKRLEVETQNSLPSSATLRNCGAVSPIPNIPCWRVYGLWVRRYEKASFVRTEKPAKCGA